MKYCGRSIEVGVPPEAKAWMRLKYRALLCDYIGQHSSSDFWGIAAKRRTYFEFEFESLKYNAAVMFLAEFKSVNASAFLLVQVRARVRVR